MAQRLIPASNTIVTPMPITDMRTILINQRGIASVSFQETDPD
jgi:hypothetical protein